MNEYLLSIQIPFTEERFCEFKSLCRVVDAQRAKRNDIELIWDDTGKEMTIGEKRNILYAKSNGIYSWQIDSDDDISPDAVWRIMEAIKQSPDCITFQEKCTIDGVEYSSNHLLEYGDWEGDGSKLLWDGWHFHRTTFFKSIIKTEIARNVPVPHIRFGEDHQWAQTLKPHLKTEVHIPEFIYYYQHTSSNFSERYGFDRET